MAGYQGMSFENQRMIRDAMDFVKKRKTKQDELEGQRIEAARLAAVAGPNAELKRTEMLIDAEKDKDYQARDQAWNRKNDAFETSKGRMSPDLFNMKWGGGADDGGGGRRRGGGNGMVEMGVGDSPAFNSRLEAAKLATTKPMVDEAGNIVHQGGFNPTEAETLRGFMDAGATGQQDYQTMARERALEEQFFGGGSPDVQQGTRKDGTRFWGNTGSDFNNGTALQTVDNPRMDQNIDLSKLLNQKARTIEMPQSGAVFTGRQPSTSPGFPRQVNGLTSIGGQAESSVMKSLPRTGQQPTSTRQTSALNTPLVDLGADFMARIKKRRESGQQRLRDGIYGNY